MTTHDLIPADRHQAPGLIPHDHPCRGCGAELPVTLEYYEGCTSIAECPAACPECGAAVVAAAVLAGYQAAREAEDGGAEFCDSDRRGYR